MDSNNSTNYDYVFCLAKLKIITGERKYVIEEMQIFKKLMSLKKTTSNHQRFKKTLEELNKDGKKEKIK